MTNDELNPNGETGNNANIILALRHSSFDIQFVIRHSTFVISNACQTNLLVARFSAPMKLIAIFFATLVFALCAASAQTPTPETAKPADATQLETLAKKIDEQNAKIDALSQEILKLEQEISHIRPGVMIGESTPAAANPAASTMSPLHSATAGNTHIVARGETLTSIAKMYKVTIDELQKANHIEDGRKLQAGQTISIPTSATPTPTPAG